MACVYEAPSISQLLIANNSWSFDRLIILVIVS